MEDISKIWFEPLIDSRNLKPFRIYYVQNDEEKNWEVLRNKDSINIVIFNKTIQKLIFIKEFRPAVYYAIVSNQLNADKIDSIDLSKFPPSLGVTLDFCSGKVDASLNLNENAKHIISKKISYNVPIDRLEKILTCRSAVGSSGALLTLYYCEVTDDDKDKSLISFEFDGLQQIVEYGLNDARELLKKNDLNNSPSTFYYALLWFFNNKAP